MISLKLAKLLLVISLYLGPHTGPMDRSVEIVSQDSYCVWAHDSDGWALTELGMVINHWPENGTNVSSPDVGKFTGPENSPMIRQIAHHDWTHDSTLYFENGDVLEKQGNKIYYTINAGAANQRLFTIQIRENGKLL